MRGFLRATYESWAVVCKDRGATIDAMGANVPGVDRSAFLGNLDLVLDFAITHRLRQHGLG